MRVALVVMLVLLVSCSFATQQAMQKGSRKIAGETIDTAVRENIIIVPSPANKTVEAPAEAPPAEEQYGQEAEDDLYGMLGRMPR